MPFYQRGFLYLTRKRSKSILLLLIFLIVNSMILGTNMILHATESTETVMHEKAGAKVICEITDIANPIRITEAKNIQNQTGVTFINRMGKQSAYLVDIMPVTACNSTELDNQKVNLFSYDDLEADGPFADQSFRLTKGKLIGPETQYSAVINVGLADANGLQIGDTITFKAESGKTVTVEVIGEYLAGNERRQENSMFAVYRMENQIYIDTTTYSKLFGDNGFYKVSACTDQPEILGTLAENTQEILQDKAEITTSDALYQQMKASLTQITRIVALMRLLTFFAGTVIVSLLLCMWMRNRQKEMVVFISMGEPKTIIFLQALLESASVFFIALICSCSLGSLLAERLTDLLLSSVETGISLQASLQFVDIALLLGIGSGVVVIAVGLSLFPVIRSNPKDILSRMEG